MRKLYGQPVPHKSLQNDVVSQVFGTIEGPPLGLQTMSVVVPHAVFPVNVVSVLIPLIPYWFKFAVLPVTVVFVPPPLIPVLPLEFAVLPVTLLLLPALTLMPPNVFEFAVLPEIPLLSPDSIKIAQSELLPAVLPLTVFPLEVEESRIPWTLPFAVLPVMSFKLAETK